MNSADLMPLIQKLYDLAINGKFGFSSAETAAEEALKGASGNVEVAIDRFVRWQIGQAATLGVVSNIGGLLTLPLTLSADIGGVAFLQLRMAAVIARLRGYPITTDEARTFTILCLLGNGAFEVLKEVGINVGTKLAGEVLTRMNQAIGARLVSSAGTTGASNLLTFVPLVGGVIGGTFDAVATNLVAEAARRMFVVPEPVANEEGPIIEGEVVE